METQRLLIRPFDMADLDAVHKLLDIDLATSPLAAEVLTREQRGRWLQWSVLSYGELAGLHQPPFGDRAIVLKEIDQVIGACGFVPCLMPFGQLPEFGQGKPGELPVLNTMEIGLFWAVSPAHQRRGYASEVGRALIDFAFGRLAVERIIADTVHDNPASIAVMRKLGMRILRNPLPEPPWMQVVGVLNHPRRGSKP
jgi:RimJ/RimL family protein N-acetyltransferase